jgi:hypothetical protein
MYQLTARSVLPAAPRRRRADTDVRIVSKNPLSIIVIGLPVKK